MARETCGPTDVVIKSRRTKILSHHDIWRRRIHGYDCLTIVQFDFMSSVQGRKCTRDASLKCEWHEPSKSHRCVWRRPKIDCYKHKAKFGHCLKILMSGSPRSIWVRNKIECGQCYTQSPISYLVICSHEGVIVVILQ